MDAEDTKVAMLARLTAREKECLRRCLLPQTAKEMAVELGVSPHAVEKRLKMARTKLGVSSSLAAARMLAQAEGYQALVPQNSDLLPEPDTKDGEPATTRPTRFSLRLLVGGMGMVITLVLGTLVLQATRSSADSQEPTMWMAGRPVATRKPSWDEAVAFEKEAFGFLDRDGSGYLDPQEVSALEPRNAQRDKSLPPAPAAGQRDPAAEAKWMAKLDTDRDGKVTEQEYIGYMIPWTLASGVPTDWHPKKGN